LQARDVVDGPVLVANGDRVVETAVVDAVVAAFERSGQPTLAVLERPHASQYGAVTLRDGAITDIVEKPEVDEYRLINGGIYAFEQSIFDAIDATTRRDGELQLPDTIARLVEEDRVRGARTGGMWVDATYPWDLLAVAEEVLARGAIEQSRVSDGVWRDDSARVHESATLRPPVVVGPDCEVGPGAVVGPNTALGRNVTIGANVTVERSLLDADTRVDAGSTVVDAVTGQDVHLGAATAVPGGPADVRVGREVFEDQRLGAVLADHVVAEGDVTLVPGALVGPEARLETGARVRGTIPEGAVVVG
jgi:glucose-1-phosphate thymidylyltransferase